MIKFTSWKETVYPVGSSYPLPLLSDPDNHLLCSVSINLSILDIFYKRNHIVCNCLWLFFSLSMAFSGSFRLQRASVLNSFLKAEYCIVCINMCRDVFVIHPLMGVWAVPPLGIVDRVAMNIHVWYKHLIESVTSWMIVFMMWWY